MAWYSRERSSLSASIYSVTLIGFAVPFFGGRSAEILQHVHAHGTRSAAITGAFFHPLNEISQFEPFT